MLHCVHWHWRWSLAYWRDDLLNKNWTWENNVIGFVWHVCCYQFEFSICFFCVFTFSCGVAYRWLVATLVMETMWWVFLVLLHEEQFWSTRSTHTHTHTHTMHHLRLTCCTNADSAWTEFKFVTDLSSVIICVAPMRLSTECALNSVQLWTVVWTWIRFCGQVRK